MIKKATLFLSARTRKLLDSNYGIGSEPGFSKAFELYNQVVLLTVQSNGPLSEYTPPGELADLKILSFHERFHRDFISSLIGASRMEIIIEVHLANELVSVNIKLFNKGRSNSFFDYYATFVITSGYLCGQSQFLNPSLLKK